MMVYQLTDEQYKALLASLELAKFNTPDGLCTNDLEREAQKKAVESIHRRFHYIVVRAIQGS